jgi:hypothetical protein
LVLVSTCSTTDFSLLSLWLLVSVVQQLLAEWYWASSADSQQYRYHSIPSGGNYEAYHYWKGWVVLALPEVRHTGYSFHRVSEHGCCHENTTAYEVWIHWEFTVRISPAVQLILFHERASKWRPPVPKHASHFLKIFLDMRRSSCLKILRISRWKFIFYSRVGCGLLFTPFSTDVYLINNIGIKWPQQSKCVSNRSTGLPILTHTRLGH